MGDKRLVCPECGHDDNLYSIEQAAIMYPVRLYYTGQDRIVLDEVDYTGGDRIVLDEGTEYSDDLYCRECDRELTTADLVPMGDEEEE